MNEDEIEQRMDGMNKEDIMMSLTRKFGNDDYQWFISELVQVIRDTED